MAGRHPLTIECEQAIYGSFPFWDKGYALLAASPGCQPGWIDAFIKLCRSLGQPPGEASPDIDSLLFTAPVAPGRWVIALGSAQGCDDRGRPGAWAFHALFLSHADYRRAGAWPQNFERYFKKTFHSGITLNQVSIEINTHITTSLHENSLVINSAITNEIRHQKKVRIIHETPTIQRFSEFLSRLPEKTRLRRSMTTMSFRHNTDFDIAAIRPRAWPADQNMIQDQIAVFADHELFVSPEIKSSAVFRTDKIIKYYKFINHRRYLIPGFIFLIGSSIFIKCNNHVSEKPVSTSKLLLVKPVAAPDPLRFQAVTEKPDLTHAVREQLVNLAERLNLEVETDTSANTIGARIAAALCYQGPLIAEPIDTNRPGGAQAKRLDDQIRRFANFKPWPVLANTSTDSCRLTLANLAWIAGDSNLSENAIGLGSRADVEFWFEKFQLYLLPADTGMMLVPTGLESHYPELVDYRLHLSRLAEIIGKK